MNLFKLLLAGAAIGVIVSAFRDFDQQRWLTPAGLDTSPDFDLDEEPVLGYDGMDVDTLLDWLDQAKLDRSRLVAMRTYEEAGQGREAVLRAIEGHLG